MLCVVLLRTTDRKMVSRHVDSSQWDARYASADLVWSAGPNVFVERYAAELSPGRMLDVAGGEGRNALWLASRGWDATLVDFSAVALDRAQRLWEEREGEVGSFSTRRADVTAEPLGTDQDLVVVAYLQLASPGRGRALRACADALAPGGQLLVVAHHTDNVTQGHGGPQDPAVCYTESDVLADLAEAALEVVTAERIARVVSTDDGERTAWDTLVIARRPA
jgi:SAM-dependent methyltransferase